MDLALPIKGMDVSVRLLSLGIKALELGFDPQGAPVLMAR